MVRYLDRKKSTVISESENSPLYFALGSHKEGGAVLGDEGGCCVDQRKPICNCVLCQAVLFCQKSAKQKRICKTRRQRRGKRVTKDVIPACLVNNSPKISNVADLKFPMNWTQTHLRDSIENRLEMEGLFDVDVSMSVVHDRV